MQKKILVTLILFMFGIACTAYAGGDAGYKKGFYIKTSDGNFLLEVNAYGQFGWSYFTPDEGDDTSKFSFRRLRPSLSGNIWSPDLEFMLEFDAARDFTLTDAYINYTAYEYASIKGGQYYVPFSREQMTMPWELQLVDRSIVNDAFSLGRDIGVTFHKMFADNRFGYAFGIFNGNGPNTSENDNNDYLYALRLGVFPNGFMKCSQSSMEDPDEVMFGIGAGIAFNTMPMGDEDLPYDVDVMNATVDLALKYRGLSFETAFFRKDTEDDLPGAESVISRGFIAQAGYMFVPETFEFAFRYAFVDPDKDIDDLRDSEFTAGWNYFFRMHKVKMQMDYSYLVTEEPGEEDLKDNRIRLQFQYKF